MATDAAKVRRFEDGLKLSIRGKIVGHNVQDMDSMVSTTLIIERELDDARSIRDAGANDKKRGSQVFSSGSGKKQRTSVPRGSQGQDQPSQEGRHFWTPSQSGQRACFQCHQPEHYRRNCPERQGSQSYRTSQSQSSVGQARTQFIPPHPSTDQRNQHQSVGAAQAPSATQTGQRGQIMGRG